VHALGPQDWMGPYPESRSDLPLDGHDETLSGLLRQVGRRTPEFLGDQIVDEDGHQVLLAFPTGHLRFLGLNPLLEFVPDSLPGGDTAFEDYE